MPDIKKGRQFSWELCQALESNVETHYPKPTFYVHNFLLSCPTAVFYKNSILLALQMD